MKETLAAEGVKGHSRFYGRVTKNWLPPQGLENFLVEKNCRALGWKMMEYYALFNSICNIVLKEAKYLVGIKMCIYMFFEEPHVGE